ncbi:hypothetical protein MHM_04540 [Candidatus Mycoplasma haemominutum 'Birmingham 1']|uniref:Uncharacterized protein n=2 Tax=Candidatus Mycoplasma haematominutum TaxID=209446 RepID=G8C3S4_9MOLU|nr:hypothetical protein MHM_04540 [Candidatus Mycoplasma haematominutum 'Birmingham 1']
MNWGGALTGLVVVELTQSYPITTQLQSWGTKLGELLKPGGGSISGNPIEWSSLFSWTTPVWTSISGFFSSTFEFLSNWVQLTFTFFSNAESNYQQIMSVIGGLQTTFFIKSQLGELLKNLHKKIPNIVKFFTESSSRNKFVKLFTGEKASKSMQAFEILSGKDNHALNKVFKVEEGVFAHLVNKFAENPTQVLDKIDRLVQLISNSEEKYAQGVAAESSSASSGTSSSPYVLNIPRLDRFLKARTETAQNIYELGLKAEIGLSSLGVPVSPTTSAAVSVLTTFLGYYLSGSSVNPKS